MEDASVIALIWDDAEPITIEGRYQHLRNVHHAIDAALEKIKAAIDPP